MPRKPPQGASALGVETLRVSVLLHAERIAPTIRRLMAQGMTLTQIAARLTEMNVSTAYGRKWRPDGITRVLALVAGTAPTPARAAPSPPLPETDVHN